MLPAELSFIAAITIGLLGSSHCIGMCGGIVGALSMDNFATKQTLFSRQLAYNLGRISSYMLVGIAAGTLGAGLMNLLPASNFPIAQLIAAAFLIALGLYLTNWWRILSQLEQLGSHFWRHIQPFGQRLLPVQNPLQAFALGMLWGWLPCGLVYTVVAWSLTTGSWQQGALLMLGFGIGTLPAMLLMGSGIARVNRLLRHPSLRTAAGIAIIGFGIYSAVSSLYPAADGHLHHQQSASSTTTQN